MRFGDKRQPLVASTSAGDLAFPASEGVARSSLPKECLAALGTLYLPEPLQFSDVASLVTNSGALRNIGNRIESQSITPRIGSFPKSDSLAYRGMMLNLGDLGEVVHNGIRLDKVSEAGRGKINFGIVLDVPVLAAFDVCNNVSPRDDVLAVVIIARQSDIPNPQLQYSLLETWDDVPSAAILHTLVFDPGKNAFRELL